MAIRIVQLGKVRFPDEGIRLGTVRRPPRGVRKDDYSRLDYFDVWLPDLAPSAALLAWLKLQPVSAQRWEGFARRYLAEMRRPEPRRWLALLMALSRDCAFSVGCYCNDPRRCHRTLLAELLAELGADVRSEDREPALPDANTRDRGNARPRGP